MATKKINYKDKAPLQTKPEIPGENKVNAEDLNQIKEVVNNNADEIELRQLKEEGKGLSKNDFTDELKAKLESLNNYNDTEIKKEISEINKKVAENTENDIKQDNEIATLKTNHTNLQEQNTKLEEKIKKDRENMINLEVEGQSIHIEDSSDLEGKLEVLGNVEQDVREGYNLLENTLTDKTVNGITVKINKDKSITLNGTATSNTSLDITGNFAITEQSIFSGMCDGYGYNKMLIQIQGSDYNVNVPNSTPQVLQPKDNVKVRIYIYAGTSITNAMIKPQINKGTVAKPYEQYGVSPSPEYPSEIRAVGDKGSVEIKKTTANYYNVKSYVGSNPPLVDKDDWITLTGNNTETSAKYLNYFTENLNLNIGKNYWIVAEIKNVSGKGTFHVTSRDVGREDGQFFGNPIQIAEIKKGDKVIFQKTAMASANFGLRTFISLSQGESCNITFRISVLETEPNKSNWKYVPYKKETKILPIQKPMLEGDYFIKEVDGWKEVHKWKKIILNGQENTWQLYETGTRRFGLDLTKDLPLKETGKYAQGYCTHFEVATTMSINLTMFLQVEIGHFYIGIVDKNSKWADVNALKSELQRLYNAGTPVILYYKLDVPTKLNCTPEQTKVLDELDNFQTYKPVTNIATDSIAKIKLKYIADTKTYIDNKTSNLEQQVNTINQLLSTTRTSSVLLDNLQKDIESEVL